MLFCSEQLSISKITIVEDKNWCLHSGHRVSSLAFHIATANLKKNSTSYKMFIFFLQSDQDPLLTKKFRKNLPTANCYHSCVSNDEKLRVKRGRHQFKRMSIWHVLVKVKAKCYLFDPFGFFRSILKSSKHQKPPQEPSQNP